MMGAPRERAGQVERGERAAPGARVPGGPEAAPDAASDAVTDVLASATTFEALLAGLVVAAGSGALLTVAWALGTGAPPGSAWPLLVGLGGGLVSLLLVGRRARRPVVVFVRGALLGAVEWQAVYLAAAHGARARDGVDVPRVPDLVHALGGPTADVMFWVCLGVALLGWAFWRATPAADASR